jgi:predicted nucleotidyltransferase
MDRKAIAKEFADRVRIGLGDRVDSIRLFGSVAKKQDISSSDIDLFILSKESIFRELKEPIGHVLQMGAVPEVVNLTRSEYGHIKRKNSPFYRTIENESIEV